MKFKVPHETLEEHFGKAESFSRFYYEPVNRYKSISAAQIEKDLKEIRIARERIILDFYKQSMN